MEGEIITSVRQRGDNQRIVSRQGDTVISVSNRGRFHIFDTSSGRLRKRQSREGDPAIVTAASKAALAFRVGLQK